MQTFIEDLEGVNLSSLGTQWLNHLNRLSSLTKLDLSTCLLSGIPQSLPFVNFTKLQVLDISVNPLDSVIPGWFSNLTSLVHLDINSAELHGSIPVGLSNLHKLRYLDLSRNDNLTADFSKLMSEGWRSLEHLDLASNLVYGTLPASIGNLTSLMEITLWKNKIEGGVPSSIGKLCNLKTVSLANNNLSLGLPLSLEEAGGCTSEHPLPSLTSLDLQKNDLRGVLPEWLGKLRNLQVLDLSYNSIQELEFLDLSNTSIFGKIPTWFWNVSKNLKLLNISFNKIEGQLPNYLPIGGLSDVDMRSNLLTGSLPHLPSLITTLVLSDNQFSGPIPPSFCDSQQDTVIVYLSLSNNNLSGQIPTSMGEILSLEVLDLSRNKLDGSIPESLQNLAELKALALEYNSLSGSIPPYIGSFQNLQTLHLGHNQLSGSIPPSLQNCSSLHTLDLGGNLLDGLIPSWFAWSLPELRILGLRYNKFSGQLPPQLSNMSSLQVLDLAHNYFEGPIPLSFGNFKAMTSSPKVNQNLLVGNYYQEHFSMQYSSTDHELLFSNTLSLVISIDLSRNKLSGHFPETMTKLAGLLVLDLSDNRLNGEIPRDISALQGLLSLDLSNNGFSGRGQLLTFDVSSYTGNDYLCGPPLNVECSLAHGNGTDHRADYGHTEEDERLSLLSVGLGFAVGLLGLFAVISIRQQWSVAYFNAIDLFILWISKVMNRFWCASNGGRKKPKRSRNWR
ncbi:hypothetical protein J5N97_007017 [Dioscorea zingiberensis]|uniref:Uncharacterized protein n=1 Tax=Dioscorea zingiberensis TaxID=325984 RepID=A0A9D5DB73_9LILI|nr:hypothetical protein J5N97_007017 [Dioscorea zingiberensis]